MRRLGSWLSLLAVCALVALTSGCASSNEDRRNDYYTRGSIHRNSFPVNYNPGRVGRVGRPVYW